MGFPTRGVHVSASRVFSYFHAAVHNRNGVPVAYPVEDIPRQGAVDATYQNVAIPRGRVCRFVSYIPSVIDDPDFGGGGSPSRRLLGNIGLEASDIPCAGVQHTVQVMGLHNVVVDQNQFAYSRPREALGHHAAHAAEADYAYPQRLQAALPFFPQLSMVRRCFRRSARLDTGRSQTSNRLLSRTLTFLDHILVLPVAPSFQTLALQWPSVPAVMPTSGLPVALAVSAMRSLSARMSAALMSCHPGLRWLCMNARPWPRSIAARVTLVR